MTIARITAQAPPAADAAAAAPTNGADAAIVAGDFADLLRGQLLPPTATLLPVADAGHDSGREANAADGIAALDPAQLLASLGLPHVFSQPPANETSDRAAAGGATALAAGSAAGRLAADRLLDGIATPAATAPATGPLPPPTDGAPAALADRNPLSFAAAVAAVADAADPAKLAGAPSVAGDIATAGSDIAPTPTALPAHAQVAPAAPAAASAAPPPTAHVALPLRDAAWGGDFAQKVVWIARQDLQTAQITLNPPQLGPIEISLDLRNDQANAAFVSASPEVREAIESALPRLREMFAGIGVELGQANVGAESFAHAKPQGGEESRRGEGSLDVRTATAAALTGENAAAAGRRREGRGLVDTFA